MPLPDERSSPGPTPAPGRADAPLSAADDAAILAAPELPAPIETASERAAGPSTDPAGAAGEPGIATLWWLIGAVVVLAVVYFMVR